MFQTQVQIRIAVCTLATLSLWASPFTQRAWAQYNPGTDIGYPDRTEGAGTRGPCDIDGTLVAIVPETGYAETVSEHPTFFWYVPDNQVYGAEFVLKDEAGNEIYSSTFPVASEAAVISVALPEHAGLLPIAANQPYEWIFSLVCDPEDASANIFTSGWFQRVEATAELQNQLAVASEIDRPMVYAESGLWYDAIGALANLYRAQPNSEEVKSLWTSLLSDDDVNLSGYADVPLTQSETANNLSADSGAPPVAETPDAE